MNKLCKRVGRFKTRDELVQNIHWLYFEQNQDYGKISKDTGVSELDVMNILKKITVN